jgi:RNA polymerase sigma-70 factor, ECF subfamily
LRFVTSGRPVELFERERRRLFTMAYGFLGSRADAEDVVQDAWLRWHGRDEKTVDNPAAWLTTVTARLALDRLRSARVKRETYPGVWLPEPIVETPSVESALLAESGLTLAFLFLLERLGAEERAAFVLREVFNRSYREIGEALGRPEASCRQLVKRAREKVRRDQSARGPASRPQVEHTLGSFLDALEEGDEMKLLESLAADAILYGDGGGKAPSVVNPIFGAHRIVRFLMGLRRKYPGEYTYERIDVNGMPGLIALRGGVASAIVIYCVEDSRVRRIFHVLNPDKIAAGLREWKTP